MATVPECSMKYDGLILDRKLAERGDISSAPPTFDGVVRILNK